MEMKMSQENFDIVKKIEKGMDELGVKIDTMADTIKNLRLENADLKKENQELKELAGVSTTTDKTSNPFQDFFNHILNKKNDEPKMSCPVMHKEVNDGHK